MQLRILHLLSGPGNRLDGMITKVKAMGHDGEDVDTVNNSVLHDIVDDAVWSDWVIAIENADASM